VAYVKAVYEMSELVLLRVLNPWLMNDFIFSLTGHGFRWKQSLKVLIGTDRAPCRLLRRCRSLFCACRAGRPRTCNKRLCA